MKKMPDKKEILNEIREALVKEELAIPLYTSHIQQTFFWSGIDEEKQKEIIKKLTILERESEAHVRMLHEVEKIYSSEE